MRKFLKRIGLDGFVMWLLVAITLAWIAPQIGSDHESWSPSEVAGWGVTVIFFFYGLRLSPSKFKAGLSNVKLHVVIHTATFILFPLLALGVMALVDIQQNYHLWVGVFFMATLPSTVSSAVVMVSMAKGNVPAAIFNASISSLMGVFLTPLWMSIFISSSNGGTSLNEVVIKLIVQVIIPIGLGLFLNRFWGKFAEKHKKPLKIFDQAVIVAIVYTAFCESFETKMFNTVSLPVLLMLIVGMGALFFAVYFIILLVGRWLKFNREDRITALFCGSKKSLVHGTVMSRILVSDVTLVGIIILPIMIYHILQLMIVSVIAQKMSKQAGN